MHRRTLMGALGASPLLWTAGSALAQTPRDLVVMGIAIDDIVSLDPQESFEFSGGEVLAQVYERLILPSLTDPTKISGVLAESWDTSEDGLTSTLAISGRVASGFGEAVEERAGDCRHVPGGRRR